MIDVVRVRELEGLEQFKAARQLVVERLAARPEDAAAQWWSARAAAFDLMGSFDVDPDMDLATVHAARLADAPEADREAGRRLALAGSYVDGARRLRERAFASLDAVESRLGVAEDTIAHRARLLLGFDERAEALAVLRSVENPTGDVALALAEALFVDGDIAGAYEAALACTESKHALDRWDLAAAAAEVLGNIDEAISLLTQALDASPEAERAFARRLVRADLRAQVDDLAGASEDLRAGLEACPASIENAVAKETLPRLVELTSASSAHRRVVLEGFPTVTQGWDECGPAVVELCLRYVQHGVDRAVIASEIMGERGTPTVAITDYLRGQGLRVVRCVLPASGVMAAIDRGWPVIVEQRTADAGHVVVAIGFDERMGTITTADPVSHQRAHLAIPSFEESRRGAGFGAIVVLGVDVDEATVADAASIGIVESHGLDAFDAMVRRRAHLPAAWAEANPADVLSVSLGVLREDPSHPVGRVSAAQTAFALDASGDGALALPRMTDALGVWGDVPEGFVILAERCLDMGNPHEAIAMLSRWAFTPECTARVHSALSRAYRLIGHNLLADCAARYAVASMPSEPSMTAHLARLTAEEWMWRAALAGGYSEEVVAAAVGVECERRVATDTPEEDIAALAQHLAEVAEAMDATSPDTVRALDLVRVMRGDASAVAQCEPASREVEDMLQGLALAGA